MECYPDRRDSGGWCSPPAGIAALTRVGGVGGGPRQQRKPRSLPVASFVCRTRRRSMHMKRIPQALERSTLNVPLRYGLRSRSMPSRIGRRRRVAREEPPITTTLPYLHVIFTIASSTCVFLQHFLHLKP